MADLVDLTIEDTRWDADTLARQAEAAVSATLARLGLGELVVEVSLLACDDARIATLNADHRGKPTATNVLSWPAFDLAPTTPGARPPSPPSDTDPFGEALFLGDIAISYDTVARESAASSIDFAAHVSHLLVHSTLHLLGYDHNCDEDAGLMEEVEVETLVSMGLANPY